jgi:hypothetical protein
VSFNTWTPLAVSSEAHDWSGALWRIVEAQHVASTMKIVDSRDEQDVLELLLEGSKPGQPKAAAELDYLLATPFRYPPPGRGSRFRGPTDPGVFYGAESVRTASAELGYWRWRFLRDAPALQRLEPVPHTAFRAAARTPAIDLRQAPLVSDAATWMHPSDYRGTQDLARVARTAGIGGIVYRSVRDPEPAWCLALLTPAAFARAQPYPERQTWWLAVHQDAVLWRRESQSMTFATADWSG